MPGQAHVSEQHDRQPEHGEQAAGGLYVGRQSVSSSRLFTSGIICLIGRLSIKHKLIYYRESTKKGSGDVV